MTIKTRLMAQIPVGTRATCHRCGRTIWLRYTATVVVGDYPPSSKKFKWRPRKGTHPFTQCANPTQPGRPEACQPIGFPAMYVLLPTSKESQQT